MTASISAVLHPAFNYLLIKPAGYGYLGSAWSNAVTQLVWLVMLLVYIYWSGLARKVELTWWPMEGVEKLGRYMRVRWAGRLLLVVVGGWWVSGERQGG